MAYPIGAATTEASEDEVVKLAREKAANVPSEETSREILAQLYVQNYLARVQNNKLDTVKSHLAFYTIMYIIALVGAMAIFGK